MQLLLLLPWTVLLCSLLHIVPACLAFSSPRVLPSSKSRTPTTVQTLLVPLASLRAGTTDSDGSDTTPQASSVVGNENTPSSVSDEEIAEILKGGTSMESIANEMKNEKGDDDNDPFGIVRVGVAAILCVGGIGNLANDASKFGASVEGGYVLGSIITLTIDTAFTLAMAGALYKEWQKMEK